MGHTSPGSDTSSWISSGQLSKCPENFWFIFIKLSPSVILTSCSPRVIRLSSTSMMMISASDQHQYHCQTHLKSPPQIQPLLLTTSPSPWQHSYQRIMIRFRTLKASRPSPRWPALCLYPVNWSMAFIPWYDQETDLTMMWPTQDMTEILEFMLIILEVATITTNTNPSLSEDQALLQDQSNGVLVIIQGTNIIVQVNILMLTQGNF